MKWSFPCLVCQLPRNGSHFLAYSRTPAKETNALPEVVFLSGFGSDMMGTKATALARFCQDRGQAFTRFDYYGHGQSTGEFTDGTISLWLEDTLEIIDRIVERPLILVGSSLGGWLMCLAALQRPERVKGLIGIAPAPDFTELLQSRFSKQQQEELKMTGRIHLSSDYDENGYVITSHFVEEARQHLLLREPVPIHCPVHIIHGMLDVDVPWTMSQRLMEQIESQNAQLTLIKSGGHRLSSPSELEILQNALSQMSKMTL
jgi:pimeloyl-ACP methyl ester carboxylesterase